MAIKLHDNPEYINSLDKLISYRDLMEGDHDTLVSERYLPAYAMERQSGQTGKLYDEPVPLNSGSNLLATRKKLSRYTNFPEKALRRYKSIIFKNDPDTTQVEEAELFPMPFNVDGNNHTLVDFIKNVIFPERFTYGNVYAIVAGVEGEENQFIKLIPTLDVKDWQIKDGYLTLFRYNYSVADTRTSSQNEPTETTYSDEYFKDDNGVYLTRYKLAKEDTKGGKEWEIVPNFNKILVKAHKEIPVAMIKGDSFIKPAESEVLTYHNLKSSLLNQLYHQGTQKIFISGNVDDKTVLAMNETTATILRSTDQTQPTVTVIEPTQPTMLHTQLMDTEVAVYKAFFHMTRSLSADSNAVESDLTLDKQKEDLLNVIKSEILELERFMNRLIEIYQVAIGKTGEITIEFDSNITVQDLDFMLKDELAYLDEIKKVPLWYNEHLKRVVVRQDYKPEVEAEIIAELETNPPSPTSPLATLGFNLNNS